MNNILVVIPARMNSKRIPGKNLCEVGGKTLIRHAVDCALESGLGCDVCISTDHPTALEIGILQVQRPPELCGDTADIADAIKHALQFLGGMKGGRYDYVITLQPAVMARSGRIIADLFYSVEHAGAEGGLTMCPTVPWQYRIHGTRGMNDWHPKPYPRSQDCYDCFAEINAVQIARRESVMAGKRWSLPLTILELPSWAVALDIDYPKDLETVRSMWTWAGAQLAEWSGDIHHIESLNGYRK